jgi:hypothetical protein
MLTEKAADESLNELTDFDWCKTEIFGSAQLPLISGSGAENNRNN